MSSSLRRFSGRVFSVTRRQGCGFRRFSSDGILEANASEAAGRPLPLLGSTISRTSFVPSEIRKSFGLPWSAVKVSPEAQLTEIQREVFQKVEKEGVVPDMLLSGPTGSGKTLAFLLPILSTILRDEAATQVSPQKGTAEEQGVSCLIVVPTRELSLQTARIGEHLLTFSREVSCSFLTGGFPMEEDFIRLQESKPRVLVVTPGRLLTLFEKSEHFWSMFQNLQFLVLDEVDRLLDLGFSLQLEKIFFLMEQSRAGKEDFFKHSASFLRKETPFSREMEGRQGHSGEKGDLVSIFCSATMNPAVLALAQKNLRFGYEKFYENVENLNNFSNFKGRKRSGKGEEGSEAHETAKKYPPIPPALQQELVVYDPNHFFGVFTKILEDELAGKHLNDSLKTNETHPEESQSHLEAPGKGIEGPPRILVICPTIRTVQLLSVGCKAVLREEGQLTGVLLNCLHSRLASEKRRVISDRFLRPQLGVSPSVLFASDVAARGLDLSDVSLVVQIGLAESGHQYLHRAGRSGRGGKPGRSILLLSSPLEKKILDVEGWGDEWGLKRRLIEPKKFQAESSVEGNEEAKAFLEASASIAYRSLLGWHFSQARRYRSLSPYSSHSFSEGGAYRDRAVAKAIVSHVNGFICSVLRRDHPPTLNREFAERLQIQEVEGVRVENEKYSKEEDLEEEEDG